jgi:hypothetical protein
MEERQSKWVILFLKMNANMRGAHRDTMSPIPACVAVHHSSIITTGVVPPRSGRKRGRV